MDATYLSSKPDKNSDELVIILCGCHSECFNYADLQGTYGQIVLFQPEDICKVENFMNEWITAGGSTMSPKFIHLEMDKGLAVISIDRPEALNALNLDVIKEIRKGFEQALEKNAKAVVFTGKGRSFIAGADIAQMQGLPGIDGRDYTKHGQDLMDYVENYPLPVIAAVNGFALGGGCEFAMACDIRLASTNAKFGQPEVNLGIIPGFGGTQRLPRLIGKGMAKYLIMSGELIDADKAERIGLVQKVVSPESLLDEAKKLARLIMDKAPIAIRVAKCAVNVAQNTDLTSGIAYELEAYQTTFNSQDRVEGMSAFLEKRQAAFKNK